MPELFQFEPNFRKAFEESIIPFAIYQYLDHKVVTLLVTDGLCTLMRSNREEILERFQNDMYKNVQQQDAYAIAQAAVRFATEGGEYDVVYRERLGDSKDYEMIHAVGEHIMMQGTRIAVVRYDNITRAIASTANAQKIFESSVSQFYDSSDSALCVVAKDRDVLLYTNRAFEKVLTPVKAYDSGITYWEYFFGAESAPAEHSLAGHCGKGRFIATDPVHKHPVVLNVREAF